MAGRPPSQSQGTRGVALAGSMLPEARWPPSPTHAGSDNPGPANTDKIVLATVSA